jgi:glycosyltransferase involved in cell wall biosynthesis
MKVLWLPSWYPNRCSPFNGDFIKRHAEAVSLSEKVQVIFVIRDSAGAVTNDELTEESVNDKLSETIIYYYSPRYPFFFDKLFSERKYRKLYKQAVTKYIQKNGKPDMVHVHVAMKAGSIALWMKRTMAIPFVVSEHWSGFLDEARERFDQLPFYFRSLWKKIMRRADGCSTVSQYLANAVKRKFPFTEAAIIPNVVDTAIFYPAEVEKKELKFIHISGLDELKNPKEIMEAFKIVLDKYPDAVLEVFGSTKKEIVRFSDGLQLTDKVRFHEEVPQQLLAKELNQSVALILYSSYETFGCVLIEANACGVPVIVSDIPVFHENIQESVNGFFVKPHDPAALAGKMIWAIENRPLIDSRAVATMTGSKFSYSKVGEQFSNWYKDILAGSV